MKTSRPLTALLYAPFDSFDLDTGHVALALNLCEATGGSLTALMPNLEANAPANPDSQSLADLVADSEKRALALDAKSAELSQEARRRGVPLQIDKTMDHSRGAISFIADHARLHGMTIAGTTHKGLLSDRMIVESLIFETGRPLLAVPASHGEKFSPRHLVVGWDNTRNAARALADAMAQLPTLERISLLIIEDEKAIPSGLDDSRLAELLSASGISTTVARRSLGGRPIDGALQHHAKDLGGDLLAMGAYGHSRLREFFFGGATLGILSDVRMPVLLSH